MRVGVPGLNPELLFGLAGLWPQLARFRCYYALSCFSASSCARDLLCVTI